MTTVLIATDADELHDEVDAALSGPDTDVVRVTEGAGVLPMARELSPDLVVLDMQIGNMGGMATCIGLRLEQGADRLPPVPVMMLLDRHADVFLAQRSGADGWLVKPVDALRLRRATDEVLGGGTHTEGVAG